MTPLSVLLREALRRAKLRPVDVSEATGIQPATLSNVIGRGDGSPGRREPDAKTAARVFDMAGFDIALVREHQGVAPPTGACAAARTVTVLVQPRGYVVMSKGARSAAYRDRWAASAHARGLRTITVLRDVPTITEAELEATLADAQRDDPD